MIDLIPNETIIFMWVIFIAVLIALSRWVFKPTLKLMEERKNKTERLLEETTQLTEKTQEMLALYEEKIDKARLEAAKEREKIINQTRSEEAKIVSQARKENETLISKMKSELKNEKEKAELQLKQKTKGLALLMVNKILERKVAIIFYFSLLIFNFSFSPMALASGGAAHQGNPSPDLSLLFKEINFLIFVFALFLLLRRPIRDFFAARSASVKNAVDESHKSHSQAQGEYQKINQRFTDIEKKSQEFLSSFKEEGELERKKILEQANQFKAKLGEDAKKVTLSELKRAKEELKEVAVLLSKEMAERIIQEKLKKEDEKRLAKNYIEDLSKLH